MSEQAKAEQSREEYSRGVPWYPLRKWWQSSRLFNQDVGLPPFLEPWDPQWMDVDRLQRSLAACSWPGHIPAPLFVPYISGSIHHPDQKISKEQYKWRVSLDVAHFSPSEISLSVRDGFLKVGGKHEERPDKHGYIARCFTRTYRLPAETDAAKIVSTLSADGILTVEAPVPETSVPAAIIIPIKVDMEPTGEKTEREVTIDTDPNSSKAPEAPGFLPLDADGKESPQEAHGSEAHPDSATAGLQQHEERRDQGEESHEKPAGESHPSVPADDEGTESLQDSWKHQEALESQESPDTPKQAEHKEAAVDGGIQMEIAQPEESELKSHPSEVPSQELEPTDIKQEHTE